MVLKRELKKLSALEFALAVSLFLPVRTLPDEKEKNRIRLKKLMRLAEEKAKESGAYRAGVFENAWAQLEKARLFEGPETKGAVIFFSEEGFQLFQLPLNVGEEVAVGDRYHIAPLLPALEPHGTFYTVALSLKENHLFRCDKSGCTRIDQLNMPNFGAIRGQTQLPADVGFHSSSRGSAGTPGVQHHSQGDSPEDYHQVQIEQYVHGAAKAVDEYLSGIHAPLIALGDPNLLGYYRKFAQHPGLMQEGVDKAYHGMNEADVFSHVWPLAEPVLVRPIDEALDRLAAGHERGDETVCLLESDIVDMARNGRIDTLLLAEDERASPGTRGPNNKENAEEEAVSLLRNVMARQTLAHGGDIFVVPQERLPEEGMAGAILRY